MSENRHPHTGQSAGSAFLIDPAGGPGSGVLVLHSWHGLNDWTKDFCRRLAAQGYTVLAPDLLLGEAGEAALGARDPDELAGLVFSSAQALRMNSADAAEPIAVVGFSMGASLAMWLSARLPTSIDRVVAFYGSQAIDFDQSTARYQGHFAQDDDYVSEEDRVTTEAFIRIGGRDADFHLYPDTQHWFFEDGDTFDPEAAELAWQRMVSFLAAEPSPADDQ